MSPRPSRLGLRDDILDAAEGLLINTGSEAAVSIRAVAKTVGCTAPSIYRHFEDKQHLIFEVCARHFARLSDFVADAVAGTDDPVEALATMAQAYVRFALDNPEHYRIMFMGRSDMTPQQYADERILESGAFGGLVALVQGCIDAGRFRSGLGDAVTVAFALWATVHGVASIAVAKPNVPGPTVDERLAAALDINLRGLLADDAR
jgi:AcrR family transcriptional regulator